MLFVHLGDSLFKCASHLPVGALELELCNVVLQLFVSCIALPSLVHRAVYLFHGAGPTVEHFAALRTLSFVADTVTPHTETIKRWLIFEITWIKGLWNDTHFWFLSERQYHHFTVNTPHLWQHDISTLKDMPGAGLRESPAFRFFALLSETPVSQYFFSRFVASDPSSPSTMGHCRASHRDFQLACPSSSHFMSIWRRQVLWSFLYSDSILCSSTTGTRSCRPMLYHLSLTG